MKVRTESGSVYELDGSLVRRSEFTHPLRRDGEWVGLLNTPHVQVGEPMVLVLEPLGAGDATVRRTSLVVEVLDGSPSACPVSSNHAHPVWYLPPNSGGPFSCCRNLQLGGAPMTVAVPRRTARIPLDLLGKSTTVSPAELRQREADRLTVLGLIAARDEPDAVVLMDMLGLIPEVKG